eukprot:2074259-Prymnesium_polylepis.1
MILVVAERAVCQQVEWRLALHRASHPDLVVFFEGAACLGNRLAFSANSASLHRICCFFGTPMENSTKR